MNKNSNFEMSSLTLGARVLPSFSSPVPFCSPSHCVSPQILSKSESRSRELPDDFAQDELNFKLGYRSNSPTPLWRTSRKGSFSTQTSTSTLTSRKGSFSRRDSTCSLPGSIYSNDLLLNWKEYQSINASQSNNAYENFLYEGHLGRKVKPDLLARKDSSSSGYTTDRKDSLQGLERRRSFLSPQLSLDLGWRNESFNSSNPSSPFFNSSGSQYSSSQLPQYSYRLSEGGHPPTQPYRSRRNSYSSLPSTHLSYPSAFLPNPSLPPTSSPTALFGSQLSLNYPGLRHRKTIS